MQEIAAETVSSWKTVWRHLLYMKVSLKPADRLRKEPERFEMRRVAGELVEDPNEQSAIEKIKTVFEISKR